MAFDPGPLARHSVHNFTPYKAGDSAESVMRSHNLPIDQIVKLGSNENAFGMSPKAAEAAQQALATGSRYPDNAALVNALAAYHKVSPEQIVPGAGSTEIIQLISQTFLEPGTQAVTSLYAFAMFSAFSYLAGASTVAAQDKDFGHNLPAIKATITDRTRVVWLANPNNPTGTFIPHQELKVFLAEIPDTVIVVIDEAYYDYLNPAERQDTTAWTAEHPNLIIIRTFSKVYGLAGLRIGYGIMNAGVANLLNRVRQPFNVSGPALAAAEAALADQAFVQSSYQKSQEGLNQFKAAFDSLELAYLPAYGNFITVRLGNAVPNINQALLKNGIIVRPLDAYDMTDYLRITIGSQEQNAKIIELMQASMGMIYHHGPE